jgi:hypothetical protein
MTNSIVRRVTYLRTVLNTQIPLTFRSGKAPFVAAPAELVIKIGTRSTERYRLGQNANTVLPGSSVFRPVANIARPRAARSQ